MPKITLTPGASYRYTGTDGVYSVILGELVEGGDVPTGGGGGGDPDAAYLVYEATGSLTNEKILAVSSPLQMTSDASTITLSIPDVITVANPTFANQAVFQNNVQMSQTLNVTGSLNLSSTGNFLLTHTGSGGTSLTIASTAGTVKVEGTTFDGNNVGVPGALAVTGASTLTGNVTFGGNIVADTDEAKSIFAAVTSQTITVGGGGLVAVAGDLKVGGNDIQSSGGTTALTLSSADVAVAGDLTVGGNDIKMNGGAIAITFSGPDNVAVIGNLSVGGGNLICDDATFNLINTTATTLNIGGQATTVEIGASTGTTSINNSLTVDGNATFGNAVTDTTIVAGSLAVNGTSGASTNKITSTQTSFNLLNDTVTTLNIGGAAEVTIGATTGTSKIRNSTVELTNATSLNLSSTSAVNITHTGASGQNLTISSTNGSVLVEGTTFAGNDVTAGGSISAIGRYIIANYLGTDSAGASGLIARGQPTAYRGMYIDDVTTEQWFAGANTASNFVIRNNNASDYLVIADNTGDISLNGQVTVGGGYGSTGVTISSTGNISAAGTLTIDGASQLTGNVTVTGTSTLNGQVTVGGGYGSTGVTISTAGAIQANGALTVDSTSTLSGQVTVGGGYGSTGVTISSTGNISADGTLTIDGASTLSGQVTVGGGYGSSGVTISTAGAIQADGAITVDSNATIGGNLTMSDSAAVFKIGTSIGNTVPRGIIIGQSFNIYGDGLTWEQAGSDNHWSAFVDTDDNLQFTWNGVDKGFIQDTVTTAGGVQMNFTGQHRVIPVDQALFDASKVGMVVVSTGEYDATFAVQDPRDNISINESLPIVQLSSARNQKSVVGIISNVEDQADSNHTYAVGAFVTVIPRKSSDDRRLIINSVGEGAIWITNINGNLENGDYITASEIPGYGMKQDSDSLKNYTVAKVTCDCNFDLDSSVYHCEEFQWNGQNYRKAFVGCSYHCG